MPWLRDSVLDGASGQGSSPELGPHADGAAASTAVQFAAWDLCAATPNPTRPKPRSEVAIRGPRACIVRAGPAVAVRTLLCIHNLVDAAGGQGQRESRAAAGARDAEKRRLSKAAGPNGRWSPTTKQLLVTLPYLDFIAEFVLPPHTFKQSG